MLAAAELSGSVAAAVAAALLFAGSYTFWSQAIIAEVYALHALLVSATLLLLLRWQVAADPESADCFLCRLCARLWQSPVDGAAAAGLYPLSAHCGARRMALHRSASRRHSRDDDRRARCAAIRVEPARVVAAAARSERAVGRAAASSGSTSRNPTGARRWSRACRSRCSVRASRCTDSTCGNSSAGRYRCWPSSDWSPCGAARGGAAC